MQFIPFVVGTLVPIYNIPSLAYADGTPGTPRLVLSTDVLADIFRGRIQYWNDSRIRVDNESTFFFLSSFYLSLLDLVLPEGPITRVLRSDNSGFTYVFTTALSLFVDDWEYKPTTTWPVNITVKKFFSPLFYAAKRLANSVVSFDNFGMIADVGKNENSIGYISLAQLVTQRIAVTTSYALLRVI